MKNSVLFAVIILLAQTTSLLAQDETDTRPPESIKSMGQPSKYEFYLAPMKELRLFGQVAQRWAKIKQKQVRASTFRQN
jgi:hypothetical protein